MSEANTELTRRISQAVHNLESISPTAKNVQIICVDGKVTLLGPVKSHGEKRDVEGTAKRVAGARNVTSQILIQRSI